MKPILSKERLDFFQTIGFLSLFRPLRAGAIGLGLAQFILGCNVSPSDSAPPPTRNPVGTTDTSSSSEYDRELIATKKGTLTQQELMAAAKAVMDKYDVPHRTLTESNAPVAQATLPAMAKAAKVFEPIVREFWADDGIDPNNSPLQTYSSYVIVAPNKTVSVSAVGQEDGTDPFLIAYTDNIVSNWYEYTINLLAYNDDISSQNRSSRITFKNTTSLNLWVRILAFNYLPVNAGNVCITVVNDGVVSSWNNRFLGGAVQYAANPVSAPKGCSPNYSKITETMTSNGQTWGGYLVVDTQVMSGAAIATTANPSTRWMNVSPVIHNGYPNFALIYKGTDKPRGPIPDNSGFFHFKQQDIYSCVRMHPKPLGSRWGEAARTLTWCSGEVSGVQIGHWFLAIHPPMARPA